MASSVQGHSQKRQLAEAALEIFVRHESHAQVAAMRSAQEEATGQMNIITGHSQWAIEDLYEYFFLKDVIGGSQLSGYLPELVETFTDRFKVLGQWRQEVGNVSAALEETPASEASQRAVLTEWMNMNMLLAAVEAAETNLEEILAY